MQNSYLSTFWLLVTIVFVSNCNNETPPETHTPFVESKKLDTLLQEQITDSATIAPAKLVFNYDTTLWSDIAHLDTSIQIDMKYATTDNFVQEQMYECGRCLLRPEVAKAVAEAQLFLQKKGYGLKMLDCYRPRPVQQKLWDKVPNASYVTPPSKGSMHNRGMAVDLTLVDTTGKELDMGTPFDFFGPKAHQTYTDLPPEILERRQLLRETMHRFGFKHIRTEWWHYSFTKSKHLISDYLWECD